MGFIENLRQAVEGKIAGKRQTDAAELTLRLDQQRQNQLREANESALHRFRREQARVFRKESGIDRLLSHLDRLTKLDPTIYEEKGHITLFTPRGVSNYPETMADFVSVSPKGNSSKGEAVKAVNKFRYDLTLDPDSLFDVVFLGSETKIQGARSQTDPNLNMQSYHVNYLMVETNPDGDIVFHSRHFVPDPHFSIKYEHRSIAAAIWRSDKTKLEHELGQAYANPDSYSVTCEVIPAGGYYMGHAGNG